MKRFEWKAGQLLLCHDGANNKQRTRGAASCPRAPQSNILYSTAISRERSATKERHYRGNDNAPLAFARGALA
ncbi:MULTISPECIES: hypothetical protein [Paraburkholderia]|uniref:hypothetical protein n=1 Tax=Paraburkholderia TaxID=1822464 RepID=UPI0007EC5F35|nr:MULTISPECIES: hypothetical protein [Paraburkholderia]MBB2999387.1 hypothetical protein [Paraburkholderia tropica]MBB6318713.1 hypothetical protein [Paraburkholderia tropica]OBR51813.1 hypothetical protein A6456_20870 [Paraburkholderia tropica]QNB14233.1 hypothetical protein G5S35_22090 [Paraburkholderia tropica]RQM50637.1 hypothetical protein EHZ19_00390 [Paraburkholderia bannensis]